MTRRTALGARLPRGRRTALDRGPELGDRLPAKRPRFRTPPRGARRRTRTDRSPRSPLHPRRARAPCTEACRGAPVRSGAARRWACRAGGASRVVRAETREAEVSDAHATVRADEHVLGLEITVHEPRLVGGREAVTCLHERAANLAPRPPRLGTAPLRSVDPSTYSIARYTAPPTRPTSWIATTLMRDARYRLRPRAACAQAHRPAGAASARRVGRALGIIGKIHDAHRAAASRLDDHVTPTVPFGSNALGRLASRRPPAKARSRSLQSAQASTCASARARASSGRRAWTKSSVASSGTPPSRCYLDRRVDGAHHDELISRRSRRTRAVGAPRSRRVCDVPRRARGRTRAEGGRGGRGRAGDRALARVPGSRTATPGGARLRRALRRALDRTLADAPRAGRPRRGEAGRPRKPLVRDASGRARIEEYAGRGRLEGSSRWSPRARRSRSSAAARERPARRARRGAGRAARRRERSRPRDAQASYRVRRFAPRSRGAVAALTPKQRNLLRLHLLGSVTLEQLASMEASTAPRSCGWLKARRVTSCSRRRTPRSPHARRAPDELASLMALAESRLDVSIERPVNDGDPAGPSVTDRGRGRLLLRGEEPRGLVARCASDRSARA